MIPLEQLKEEFAWNFPFVYEWTDVPHFVYKKHYHKGKSRIFILSGQVDISFENGKTVSLKEWDMLDVPQNTFHTAQVWENGCSYLVGQEFEEDENYE